VAASGLPAARRTTSLVFLVLVAGCAPPAVLVLGGGDGPPAQSGGDASAVGGSPAPGGPEAGLVPGGFPPSGALDAGAALPASACAGAPGPEAPSCAAIGVVIDPYYAGRYTCFDLGPVPGLPPEKYGGLTLTLDRCSTTLLIGGSANLPAGKLYSVGVRRDGRGHIAGFTGASRVHADAPYNDGGVTYGPGGVLFLSRWPSNEMQQTRPGSTAADKVIPLADLGIAHASASLSFVPTNLPGAGALKLVSWTGGQWYTLALQADAAGTYDVLSAKHELTLPGGPEGFVYVAAGSPLFLVHSLLVSEWTANGIATYESDDAGNPRVATRRPFITGLDGAEGAYRDPATGDFFFSTWGQAVDRVVVVRGFAPIIE
jgi:hypothetical protein